MALSDWLILGGVILMNKSIEKSEEEKRVQQIESLAQMKKQAEKQKEIQCDIERKSSVEMKRTQMPCFFNDGISEKEFQDIVFFVGNKLKRIKNIKIESARIYCSVESQTGLTNWNFILDFNNWGHLTGKSWLYSENLDSNLPVKFQNIIAQKIKDIILQKSVEIKDFSYVVENNDILETTNTIEYIKKYNFLIKLFKREPIITLKYDRYELIGEHIYPIISLLKAEGFCNIKTIPIKTIDAKSSNYLYEVNDIIVTGDANLTKGTQHKGDNEITIYYYDKKEILFPYSNRNFKNRLFSDVKDVLYNLGFLNIHLEKIPDLTFGFLVKDGAVEEVTRDNGQPIAKNDVYAYDTDITIRYHTFKL